MPVSDRVPRPQRLWAKRKIERTVSISYYCKRLFRNTDRPMGSTQVSALHLALDRWTQNIGHIAGSETRTVQDPILKRGTSNCQIIRPATRTRPTLQTLPAIRIRLENSTLRVARTHRLRLVPRIRPAPQRRRRQPRLRMRRNLLKGETMALAKATVGSGSS